MVFDSLGTLADLEVEVASLTVLVFKLTVDHTAIKQLNSVGSIAQAGRQQ